MPVSVPDAEGHLRAMDENGIQAAVTSLTPRVLTGDASRRTMVARACNEFQATRVRDYVSVGAWGRPAGVRSGQWEEESESGFQCDAAFCFQRSSRL